VGRWAGFVYMALPIAMPVIAIRFERNIAKQRTVEAT
jgi:hypothetical protein